MSIYPRVPYTITQIAEQENNYQDWYKHKDQLIGNDEIATIDSDSNSDNAMTASIPNPLARIYLFKSAFEFYQNKLQNNIREYNTAPFTNSFASLVSDCLDFLQFLYENPGADLKIVEWNIRDELRILSESNNNKHQQLSKTLGLFFNAPEWNEFPKIQLIFYIKRNGEETKDILIGGTSPFTMVYTSPNWKRDMINNGIHVQSKILTLNGEVDSFFDHEIKPLEVRTEFSKFLYSYININTFQLNDSIRSYINSVKEAFFPDYTANLNNQDFVDLTFNNLNIEIENNTYKAYRNDNIDSDFFIKCDTPRNPAFSNQRLPIIICKDMPMPTGRRYFGTVIWSNSNPIPVVPINSRYVPGSGNDRYPYLTTEDFFEEKLIPLNHVNNTDFHSYTGDEQKYILPLKLLFFDFFNADQICNMLSFRRGTEGNRNYYTFTLKIPVTNREKSLENSFVELKKIYNDADILQLDTNFHLALTPNTYCNDDFLPNTYNIITTYETSKIKNYNLGLNFFSVRQNEFENAPATNANFICKLPLATIIDEPANEDNGNVIKYNIRTAVPSRLNDIDELKTLSGHYYINQSFNFIQLKITHSGRVYNGIISPKFKPYDNRERNSIIEAAIDFGTSNTFVAIKKGEIVEPLHFEIQGSTPFNLVSILNANEFELLEDIRIKGVMKNEFMPQVFVKNSDRDYHINFPNRTVMYECEEENNRSSALFLKSNIAYFYESEETGNERKGVKTITNIKTNFDGDPANNKVYVRNYIEQILLKIKQKALIERASIDNLKIKYTYPSSASNDYKEVLLATLLEKSKEIFGINANGTAKVNIQKATHGISESAAPLYYIKKNNVDLYNIGNIVNIDIGGGTTDIVYFFNGETRISSVKFAGNDLWGHYKDEIKEANGFIKAWESIYLNDSTLENTNAHKRYRKLKESNTSASDLINLLFKYDATLKFSGIFENLAKHYDVLKFPLLLHFSSILYFVLLNIKKMQEEGLVFNKINCFSFTGKGSSYLKILFKKLDTSTTPAQVVIDTYKLKNFITAFVTNFNALHNTTINLNLENPILIFTPPMPKEVTAYGALYAPNEINNDTQNNISIKDIQYKDIYTPTATINNPLSGSSGTNTSTDIKEEIIHEHIVLYELLFKPEYFESYNYADIFYKESKNFKILANFFTNKNGLGKPYENLLSSCLRDYTLNNNNESKFFHPFKAFMFEISNKLFEQINNGDYNE